MSDEPTAAPAKFSPEWFAVQIQVKQAHVNLLTAQLTASDQYQELVREQGALKELQALAEQAE